MTLHTLCGGFTHAPGLVSGQINGANMQLAGSYGCLNTVGPTGTSSTSTLWWTGYNNSGSAITCTGPSQLNGAPGVIQSSSVLTTYIVGKYR